MSSASRTERATVLHRTSIGKKAVMAVTGVILVGFVVVHLLGNLQVFLGPEAMNEYAANLRRIPALLWGARLVLLGSVLAHTWAAIAILGQNADARPVEYAHKSAHLASTYASRWMRWSGPIVLLYLIYHLLHLTGGQGYSEEHPFSPTNVYDNVVWSFRDPLVAGVYIVANILVALHLRHGVWSMLQTLGVNHPRYNAWRDRLAVGIAGFVLLGSVGIPAAVLAGAVKSSDELAAEAPSTEEAEGAGTGEAE